MGDQREKSAGAAHWPPMSSNNPFLEPSPYAEDGGELIGRDPRKIPAEDWDGLRVLLGLKAIRAKCLDCAYTPGEVRKCVQTDCPLWPLRMGSVPKGIRIARMRASASLFADPGSPTTCGCEPDKKPAHEPESDAGGGR